MSHVTGTPLSRSKGQLAGAGSYCGGLPHSLLLRESLCGVFYTFLNVRTDYLVSATVSFVRSGFCKVSDAMILLVQAQSRKTASSNHRRRSLGNWGQVPPPKKMEWKGHLMSMSLPKFLLVISLRDVSPWPWPGLKDN